jgi:hypothetical protein
MALRLYKKIKNNSHSKQGFALLMGVLVASVLLALTMVMFSISLKQLTLSTVSKESQIALYAADTGLECALYWDLKGDGNQSLFDKDTAAPSQGVVCAGNPAVTTNSQTLVDTTKSIVGGSGFGVTGNFQIDLIGNSCVIVKIYKTASITVPGKTDTRIESRGYNTCNINSPQRLERGLEVNY